MIYRGFQFLYSTLRFLFTSVIPWRDHGIQLKILNLLVFIVFMDPVVKPRGRGDTLGFTGTRNNAYSQ
ncbi:hypothetical protein RRIM16_02730 [Rickettsia conorii subsp. raoultii]|nr:hypothetical protein RRIM16_02730 [Rickettsia conorii subsp. raoultii]